MCSVCDSWVPQYVDGVWSDDTLGIYMAYDLSMVDLYIVLYYCAYLGILNSKLDY